MLDAPWIALPAPSTPTPTLAALVAPLTREEPPSRSLPITGMDSAPSAARPKPLAGGPLAKGLGLAAEGAESIPVIGKLLEGGSSLVSGATKAAKVGVGVEGAGNAIQGASNISTNRLNAKNATQTGLGTLQALLGAHGAGEMSSSLETGAPSKWNMPEGTTLADVLAAKKSMGMNPSLGEATQNPLVQQGEDVLSK